MGLVAAGLALAGTAVQTIGAIGQGNAAAANARYQAQVAANNQVIAEQNAQYATKAGEAQAYDQGLKSRAAVGRVVAGLASEGVDVNTGSAADVREGEQQESLTGTERVRQAAALRAYGYRAQSTNFGAESQLLAGEAPQLQEAGFLKAGGTLLSGASSFAGKWPSFFSSDTGDWSPRPG